MAQTTEARFAAQKKLHFRSRPWDKRRIVISDADTRYELLDYWSDTGHCEWANGQTKTISPNDLLGALKLAHAGRRSGRFFQPLLRGETLFATPHEGLSTTGAAKPKNYPRRALLPMDRDALQRLRNGKTPCGVAVKPWFADWEIRMLRGRVPKGFFCGAFPDAANFSRYWNCQNAISGSELK